jgi:primosomal protein N' (replication factor Y)
MPRVVAQGESDLQLERDPLARAARLPSAAFEAARAALAAGLPVLVQTPRAGYVPWLSCAACRETARCRHCAGPLSLPGQASEGTTPFAATGAALPTCRWCGRAETAYRCGACGSRRLRAGVVGSRRTAEELGRAFPGVPVRTSGGGAPVIATVAGLPEIVVATPGAEPRAAAGYGAALLLDGWALLARPDLRVAEETLRRWMAAAAAVVPHTEGGRVLVMADPGLAPVQALVRWDPVGHAATELAARTEVGLPLAVRMAAIEGPADALKDLLDGLSTDLAGVEVLGPVAIDPQAESRPNPATGADAEQDDVRERALVCVPRAQGAWPPRPRGAGSAGGARRWRAWFGADDPLDAAIGQVAEWGHPPAGHRVADPRPPPGREEIRDRPAHRLGDLGAHRRPGHHVRRRAAGAGRRLTDTMHDEGGAGWPRPSSEECWHHLRLRRVQRTPRHPRSTSSATRSSSAEGCLSIPGLS